jgi:pimeloyl-ACP methyl ester carboxylesterase
MGSITRRSFVAGSLCLAGCTRFERPPLPSLYEPTLDQNGQPPLIIVPGAFGSSLRDRRTGVEIWPGSTGDLLVSNYHGLELEIDPATLEPVTNGVEPEVIFREGLGKDFYGEVLLTLQRAGGYHPCKPGEPAQHGRRNYYVYVYDYRLDNVTAARGLHDLIEQIRAAYGDSRMQVDVLAHSNGGLLVRYYARYGTADLPESGEFQPTNAGAPAIRRLLLVGPPNLGTIQPVLSLLRGEEIGLGKIPPEVMATCPAPPQLMPHPAIPWLVDLNGRIVERDLYSADTWRDSRWMLWDPHVVERTVARHGGGRAGRAYLDMLREYVAKQLHRGQRFVQSLAVPGGPGDVRPYIFGGDCAPTLARLVLESVGGTLYARERAGDIANPVAGIDYDAVMFEPGDTVVTRSSLLGRRTLNIAAPREQIESIQLANSVFICEHHQSLTGNPTFQDNLLNALLSVDPA